MLTLLLAALLNQNQASQTRPQPPRLPPPESILIGIGCQSEAPSGPTATEPTVLDYGKASGGGLFLSNGSDLWLWRQTDRGQRFLEKRGVPSPPRGAEQHFEIPKWRNGTFWFAQGGKSVVRHDRVSGQWLTLLTRSVRAEDFEIAPSGRVVLIGTATHLIEVFEPGSEVPAHSVPYPDLGLSGADKRLAPFLWKRFKTAVCDEFIVIYAGVLGRLYAYDTSLDKLRELSVPWTPLSTQGIGLRIAKDGGVLCMGFPSPQCFQLIPDLGLQVVGVFQIQDVEIAGTQRMGPLSHVPLLKRKDGGTVDKLQRVSWSLPDGARSERDRDVGLALPVWLDGKGDLLPLSRVLRAAEAPEAPKAGGGPRSR